MDKLDRALQLAMACLPKNEYLEDGDEFVTVFNDAVLIVKHDGPGLDVKFIAGEPYRVDFNLEILEGESDNARI